MRDLDINQLPPSGRGEEEWTTASMELDEDDTNTGGGDGGPPRKKLRLTKEQSRLLEESFRQNHTLNPKQKEALAMQLQLKARQVEVWFQNRRARVIDQNNRANYFYVDILEENMRDVNYAMEHCLRCT
ncbi:hypothetical protein HYC85_023474 [Camellia sinensis]|uniref:Homeobox domain-containing protein n=1 Tax=Camellia sinensis TaxID=4442 RepID=A0A7J7GFY3_CAMSI|nr:hypothetical protein HYC85_023474 [Camellia sinensis]